MHLLIGMTAGFGGGFMVGQLMGGETLWSFVLGFSCALIGNALSGTFKGEIYFIFGRAFDNKRHFRRYENPFHFWSGILLEFVTGSMLTLAFALNSGDVAPPNL